jgi:hypothetical protein
MLKNAKNLSASVCASVMIYNQWGSNLMIGMYCDRWMLLEFSKYTNEWRENLLNFGKEQKKIISYVPSYEENDECEFISKKKVCSLLLKWLDSNDQSGDFGDELHFEYMNQFWGW